MRSPSFVSGTTVWAATLCSGVEISPFDDARDPRAGDAYPQRLPPRRTPGASQLRFDPQLRPAPAAQLRPGPQLRPRAPQLRSGLKLSFDPARRFGPAGDMRRAVNSPRCLATAIYCLDAFPSCLPWQDMRAMYPNSPAKCRWGIRRANISPPRGVFAVRSPQIMHGAQILPSSDELGPCAGMTTPALANTFHPLYLPALRQCSPPRSSQRLPLCFCASFRSVASLRQRPVS